MYELGLVSISFRKNSPEEILSEMVKANLKVIEWGSDVHAPCNDLENLKNIVALQEKYGVKCSSYGTYFRLGVTPIEELPSYITAAKILGTDILRLWCGDKGSAEFSEVEKQELFFQCKKAAEIAENADVKLCMECHNNTYTDELSAALELMAAVNSPNFRMYWQPNQYKSIEENFVYANKIAKYVEIIHTFNWKGKEKFPLAEGAVLWENYLTELKVEKPLLLEFMPDDRIESLAEEVESLRRIAGEKN